MHDGDLVQVILAGANRAIDPPLADGTPGGDDQLAQNPGLPFAMNPASFTHYANTFYSPEAILIQAPGNGPEPALHIGSRFYVRVWNGPEPLASTMYYNSATLTQDYPIGLESCGVDSAVRTVRSTVTLPALITYAVGFDGGHAFTPGAPPAAPVVVILADSAHAMLTWPPVLTATSYRIEHSADWLHWDSLGTTPDTAYIISYDPALFSVHHFRVKARR